MVALVIVMLMCLLFPGPVLAGETVAGANITPETSLKLVLCERLKSGYVKPKERVHFRVDEDLLDPAGNVLIRKGTPAFGTVLNSRKAGILGRRGALDVSVDFTTAVDGQKIPLRASKATHRGGGDRGLTAAGAIFVAWPLAFCKGSNVTIDAGTSFFAFSDGYAKVTAGLTQGKMPGKADCIEGARDPAALGSASSTPNHQNGVGPVYEASPAALPAGLRAITLQNGDRVTGRLLGMKNGVYEIQSSMGTLRIPEKEVRSIISGSAPPVVPTTEKFNPDLPPRHDFLQKPRKS